MTSVTFVWRNLWRNPTRTALTIGSLAISLFLFTMLTATVRSMKAVAADSSSRLRLVVHHKTTIQKLLPLGHGDKLGTIPGVRSVCGMRWFGGRVAGSQEQFPSMAVDAGAFPVMFDDFLLGAQELAQWSLDRRAAVVGVGLAGRMGWKAGDRVTLKGSVPPYLTLDYRVAGITSAAAFPNVFVFRLDYLHEALRANPMMPAEHDDAVNIYWLKADSAGALERVRGAADALFAHSNDRTMTELEEAFVSQFTKMFGDIPAIVYNVGLVVLVSILLVVCNTISMAVRERMGELALLKAVGYRTRRIVATVMGEALLMGVIGGALGCLPALLVFGLSDAAGLSMPYFPIVVVSPAVVLAGIAASALIGLAATIIPARQVARLSVTAALRHVG